MSKEELRKWHNKYLLWHKLHPRQSFERCSYCKHYKLAVDCPRKVLIDRRHQKYLIEVDSVTELLKEGDICIEWIKYV
jgi:hypothetical protein